MTEKRKRPTGDVDQGVRPESQTLREQLTREDLRTMTPAQIVVAKKAGRLDDLLSGR